MMRQLIAGHAIPVQDPVMAELEKAVNSLIQENIALKQKIKEYQEIIAAYENATDIGPDELN